MAQLQQGAVTGSLVVTGTVTAQEFHTEFVSSSITFQSGSTSFGNSSDDIHNRTGSLKLQGAATITGNVTANAFSGDGSNLTGIVASTATSASHAEYADTTTNALQLGGVSAANYLRTTSDTFVGNLSIYGTDTSGVYASAAIEIGEIDNVGSAQSTYAYSPALAFHWGGRKQAQIRLHSDGELYIDGSQYAISGGVGKKIWHAGNDGASSGLDADTVDGIQGASLLRSDANDSTTGILTFAAGSSGTLASRTGFSDFLGYNASYGSYIGGGVSNASSKYLYAGGFINDGTGVKTLWHSGNDGAGSGLDADTLDGLQPKSSAGQAGANQILRTHSNGYLVLHNWIDVGSAGLYSSTSGANGAHLYPNQSSDYGAWRMDGTRNGYNGITFSISGTCYTGIVASSTEIGLFNDSENEWLIEATRNGSVHLYHDGTKKLTTVTSGVEVYGDILLTGTATTSNQSRTIDFTGFDKEGTTDFTDRAYIRHTTNTGGHAGSVLVISSQNDSNDGIAFSTNGSSHLKHNNHIIWTAGNDGAGSGLDADTLDGVQGASYFRSDAADTGIGFATYTNINSSGDAGLGILSGARLGFDQSGTRSWTVKAASGQLQFNSGDGGGSIYFGTDIVSNNKQITGLNNLAFADPGPNEGIAWSGGNWKIYESPNDLTTNTAGNLQFVSGSTRVLSIGKTGEKTLEVIGSGSIVFDVQGSQGQLFSVSDDLIGDVFSVADVTGIPILNINSNGTSSFDGDIEVTQDINVGDGSRDSRVIIKKADNNVADQLQIYNGTTRVGEIGTQDNDWLRINQHTSKNIYTPRYFRADGGLFVINTNYGIGSTGRLLDASFSGAYSNSISFSNSYTEFGNNTANVSNDGSWNARVNVAGTSHARIDARQSTGDGIITSIYAHDGHGAGKVGTMSDHPLKLMVNGNDKVTIDSSSNVTATTFIGALTGTATNADKLDNIDSTSFLRSDTQDAYTPKRIDFGASSGWDAVGFGNMTNLHVQGHNQFWFGAGNGTWFIGTANTKSSTAGLAADATAAHDLLISTMQSTSTYDRGITFAVDSGGAGTSGWRLGKWHSSNSQASSKLTIDGGLHVRGGDMLNFDYYADDYSTYWDNQAGGAYWTGDTGWIDPSITAGNAIQIQAGNTTTNANNPALQFHQYGYGGVQLRYDGPGDVMHLESTGTNRYDYFQNTTDHGYIQMGPMNTSHAHIYTDRPNFYLNKTILINGDGVWHAGNFTPSNYLTTTGKASDSDLIDGIDSSRIVYGSGANKINDITDMNSRSNPSGFFQGYNISNSPTSGTWYNLINVRHSNTGNSHGFQIAASYYNEHIYTRTYSGGSSSADGTYTTWAKQWHDRNDGAGSGLDADLLDGVQGASFLRSDAADSFSSTITMATQKALVANNYGRGVYGLYSATRYQHVWSMGTSYNLSDDGTSAGNLYGLAFTHTNIGGQSKAGLAHQLLIMDNGTTKSAIGRGVWTDGTIQATGDIVAYYSDMRLKTKLGDIENPVDKIKFLNGFYYEPNDKAVELGYKKERRVGLSAQEVQEVMPEAVHKAAINDTDEGKSVNEDYLSVDYSKIVPLLVEGIKEQQDTIENQQKQIDELKDLVNNLINK